MRIVSRGELRELLYGYAEDPETGTGFVYEVLPQTITGHVWLLLDEQDRSYYVADEGSFEIVPRSMGAMPGTVTGVYTRFVLPSGSYDAFLVNR